MTAPLVEVERLSKRYGRVRALNEISFSVAEGEVFGFLGPNGAGKTTTIRILLGHQHQSGGAARIGGHNCWTDHVQAARLFGATLEQPALYGFLSGRDNLRLFARTLGRVDEKQITQLLAEVEELCDRVVVLHRGEVKAAGPLSELMNVKGFQYRIDVSDVDEAMKVVRSLDGLTVEPGTIKDSILVS